MLSSTKRGFLVLVIKIGMLRWRNIVDLDHYMKRIVIDIVWNLIWKDFLRDSKV